jgi:hypothetical protein
MMGTHAEVVVRGPDHDLPRFVPPVPPIDGKASSQLFELGEFSVTPFLLKRLTQNVYTTKIDTSPINGVPGSGLETGLNGMSAFSIG